MNGRCDRDLLREYAEEASEEAFGEIVRRYTDLVYSAALRQVGSPEAARDIAQRVFSDLARKASAVARRLQPEASLSGWLYRGTRYAALTHLRNGHRRKARERQAMEECIAAAEAGSDWERVGPVLDEAMSDLSEAEREALLLRFFENRDLRAVGAALGVSEDAAQKRVMRSLEKLRRVLRQRGVTTTGAGLTASISVHAVQAAPTGLAAALTSESVAAGTATGMTVKLLEFMAATKQISIISGIVVASVVTPLMIQHQAQGRLREQEAVAQRENERAAQVRAENRRLSNLLAQAGEAAPSSNGELLRLRGEVGRLRLDVEELTRAKAAPRSRKEMLTTIAQRYSERIAQLKEFLEANPGESVPELQFMTEKDWLWLAGEKTADTAEGYQRAMSLARLTAEGTVTREILRPALLEYARDHNGQFPRDVSQLKPYFKTPVDDAILQRWQILPASKLINLRGNLRDEDWVITQKGPVNRGLDQRIVFSLTKFHMFAGAAPDHWEVAP